MCTTHVESLGISLATYCCVIPEIYHILIANEPKLSLIEN